MRISRVNIFTRVTSRVDIFTDMNDTFFFNVLLILIVSGYVKSNISKSDVAETASTIESVASTLDSLDNIKTKHTSSCKNKSKGCKRSKRSEYPNEQQIKEYEMHKDIWVRFLGWIGIGVDHVVSNIPSKVIERNKQKYKDLYMVEHDKTQLKYRIENDEVVIGDIVTCLMANQETQHYGVVINSQGDTFNFGGETPVKTLVSRVDGYNETISVEKLSDAYNNKCYRLPNKFTRHYVDLNRKASCFSDAKLWFVDWLKKFNDRYNYIRNHFWSYDLLKCNCQVIAMYIAYGYLSNGSICNSEIGVLNKFNNTESYITDDYIRFLNTCTNDN